MMSLYHFLVPHRFMQVNGEPLPQVLKQPTPPRESRKWPWTLLGIVVVTCGIVFMLYLDGHVGANNDLSSPNNNNATGTTTTTGSKQNETNAPTTTPQQHNDTTSSSSTNDVPSLAPMTQPTIASPQPTFSPTVSLLPTKNLPQLIYAGWCSELTPCWACQGSCFQDVHCHDGLACWQRAGFTTIPGCSGAGIFGVNYCYKPIEEPLLEYVRECSPEEPCGMCQGDCDDDEDCKEGLTCQKRMGLEPITNCAGIGIEGKDYCIWDGTTPTTWPTRAPTAFPTRQPTILPTQDPTRAPTNQPTASPTTSVPTLPMLVSVGECSPDYQCGLCQGDCDEDVDCEDGLVCRQRRASESVPGCLGIGDDGKDYCILVQHNVPTPDPTTKPPAQDPDLVFSGDCSLERRCGLCEGDCDRDSDCKEGLICEERYEFEPVTGCTGVGEKGKDYCVLDVSKPPTQSPTLRPTLSPTRPPPTPWPTLRPTPFPTSSPTQSPVTLANPTAIIVTQSPTVATTPAPIPPPVVQQPTQQQDPQLGYKGSCNESNKCGLCQGECTDDKDCEAGLLCFQRSDYTPIPGCKGSGNPRNYCYKPNQPVLTDIGDCSVSNPCRVCQGDCDRDEDCGPGLLCLQRSEFEPVPGCAGDGQKNTDYCYEAFTLPDTLDVVGDCTVSSPCDKCQGDCIQDADCQGNLVCFRRAFGEQVPGCISGGAGDFAQANYCHEPPDGGPVSYIPGDLTVNENGLLLSTGLTARIIATYGKPVVYDTGGQSLIPFHKDPDAGAVFETSDGGWIYVSNSEENPGGVGAIRFDSLGRIVNYKMIAESSTDNCGGGKTWWNTWLTCEEKSNGSVWETDPWGIKPERQITLMGTGRFESAAYYRPTPSNPTFYITEDVESGALRRFTPDRLAIERANLLNDYSELLHSNITGTAKVDFLKLFAQTSNSGTFEWTTDKQAARDDAKAYYSFSEGIDIARGIAYVTAKKTKRLLALDLEHGTWESSSTESGAFNKQPDQIKFILGGDKDEDILYFCEDGGENSGVHGRDMFGNFYNVLNGKYDTETTGLAFSPDYRFLYVSYQENPGLVFEVKRRDGYPFAGTRLDIKYSKMKT